MSQIALDGFYIVTIFDTHYREGVSEIMQAAFRNPHSFYTNFSTNDLSERLKAILKQKRISRTYCAAREKRKSYNSCAFSLVIKC